MYLRRLTRLCPNRSGSEMQKLSMQWYSPKMQLQWSLKSLFGWPCLTLTCAGNGHCGDRQAGRGRGVLLFPPCSFAVAPCCDILRTVSQESPMLYASSASQLSSLSTCYILDPRLRERERKKTVDRSCLWKLHPCLSNSSLHPKIERIPEWEPPPPLPRSPLLGLASR